MVVFPNCKINIGLRIVSKRPDGFHNLETIFFPVGLKDALEIIEAPGNSLPVTWSQSGIEIPGAVTDNLCIKAYQSLKTEFPHIPPVNIHLLKAIPLGAGLGGGSADAAFMLKAMNEKFSLHLSGQQLIQYALQLGSDCPFFIINKPCFATGRGELLEEINPDLSNYKILMVNPGIHINTGWAFSKIKPGTPENSLKTLASLPINEWQENIHNDFEKPVMDAHPEMTELKQEIIAMGAVYASMSGSGSTFYGIFHKNDTPALNFPANYFQKWV